MSESRDLVTADAIQRSVINRIAAGVYEANTRLPSVRDLASELGSNRSTVNKAYQNLISLGVIEAGSSSRHGFRVKGLADVGARSSSPYQNHFRQQMNRLVWEGMASGIAAEEVLRISSEVIQDIYRTSALRLAFYECNEVDSREMGGYLSRALGLDISCCLLSDFEEYPEEAADAADLVITTFHHVAEVVRYLPGDKEKVVGIDTRLTPETLLAVAHLEKPRIGVVCGVQATAHMLEHVLHGYYPHLTLEATTLDEPTRVQALAQTSDHIVATRTCSEEAESLIGRPVDVVANFQVDEQSLTYVKQRIQKIQATRLAAAPMMQNMMLLEGVHGE